MKFDVYIASIGRSGSTAIANYLTNPAYNEIIFIEPSFFRSDAAVSSYHQLKGYGFDIDGKFWVDKNTKDEDRYNAIKEKLKEYKWGFKEVLSISHESVIENHDVQFLFTIRNIRDVYLSYIEKTRVQNVENWFPQAWCWNYCIRESGEICRMIRLCEAKNRRYIITRYEEFFSSKRERDRICAEIGFIGDGKPDRHFKLFGRSHEAEIFQGKILHKRTGEYLTITEQDLRSADELSEVCDTYQRRFDYT